MCSKLTSYELERWTRQAKCTAESLNARDGHCEYFAAVYTSYCTAVWIIERASHRISTTFRRCLFKATTWTHPKLAKYSYLRPILQFHLRAKKLSYVHTSARQSRGRALIWLMTCAEAVRAAALTAVQWIAKEPASAEFESVTYGCEWSEIIRAVGMRNRYRSGLYISHFLRLWYVQL